MITVISRFRVRNQMEQEVRAAFLDRPRFVGKAPGFCGLDVMTDVADPSVFLLLTRWANEESFRVWHRSAAHHESHERMPHGLKLDPSFTSLTVGASIVDPAGIQNLGDAVEGQTVAILQWLLESDAVFALLLAPDGVIRARNAAAHRIFPPDPAKGRGTAIWDFLLCSDSDELRRRLAGSENLPEGPLLLNMTDGNQNRMTLEFGLVRCSGAMLLLGTQEYRHDAHFQAEIFKLTDDLSLMMRDAVQKNRELKLANEAVARLARTDALTGLANRRTLDETLLREIARAARQGDPLSMVIGDLDHFKSINDTWGHLAGDQVLTRAAAVFASQLRPYDLAARFGGEEFVVLLPGSSAGDAAAVAERIRKEIATLELLEGPARVTVSLGIATWIAGETPDGFIARADAALYNAKSAGRNRVAVASEVQV